MIDSHNEGFRNDIMNIDEVNINNNNGYYNNNEFNNNNNGSYNDVTINNKVQQCADFSWVMSHPFNMLGKLPVLSVPSGFSSSNVPTGIQIIARSYSDELVFQGGYNYEMLDPWLNSSKNRPSMGL